MKKTMLKISVKIATFLVSSLAMIILVGLSTHSRAKAADLEKRRFGDIAIENVKSLSYDEKLKLLSSTSSQRREDEKYLVERFEAATLDEERVFYAFLLGQYRMEGGVKILAKYITLSEGRHKDERTSLASPYPARLALIRIGTPAVNEMLRIISSTDNKTERSFAITVLREIEGPVCTPVILEHMLRAEKDAPRRDNIQSAIEELKRLTSPNKDVREEK